MTRILVLWEDKYHDGLQICLKRALRKASPVALHLFSETARGNGGFGQFLAEDWPLAALKGLAKSHGPIHHLVCVADADRAEACCGIERAPAIPSPTAEWVERANRLWTEKLREVTHIAPDRVHGRFLRWNYETLLIAGHDNPSAMACLGGRGHAALLRHLAEQCAPSPLRVADDSFVDQYRQADRCLTELLHAAGCPNPPKKGSLARDDALREISQDPARLCARIPDLRALAELLLSLSPLSDE